MQGSRPERTGGQSTSFTLGVLARALQAHLHPSTLIPINNLGLLQDKGDFVAVEPLYREALGGWRETLGDRHPHTLLSIRNLGALLKEERPRCF